MNAIRPHLLAPTARRLRRWGPVLLVVAVLLAAPFLTQEVGYSASTEDGGPNNVTTTVQLAEGTTASGGGWWLSASQTDAGLCLAIVTTETPGASEGCNFGVPHDRKISYIHESTEAGTVVAGVTEGDVARVNVGTESGIVTVETFKAPPALNSPSLSFFVAYLPPETSAVFVAAVKAEGVVVEVLAIAGVGPACDSGGGC